MSPPAVSAHATADSLDARWVSWQAARAVQDRLWNRRAAAAATVALVTALGALGLAFLSR
jgi:hypothetical protein